MIFNTSPVKSTSQIYSRSNKPPSLVSPAISTTVLDESEPKPLRTKKQYSLDLIRAIQFYASKNNSIPLQAGHRRMSLANDAACFDQDQTLKRNIGVNHVDGSSGVNESIYISESFPYDKHENVPGDTNVDLAPNSPHPLIEYPPLYFILKRHPKIMNALERFYKIRWELQYPLQRQVFLSKKLRKIGITATWGESLLMLPFVIILARGLSTSFVHPSVVDSGIMARLPLIICFLTANHNSIITLLLGIPFERAIKYHKISGYLAFFNGCFHTYVAWEAYRQEIQKNSEVLKFASADQVNMSGTLLLCIILSMILTASPYARRMAFEVFYYFHIFFAMAMIGCAFYHSGILIPILASTLWGVDLAIRKIYMAHFRYPRTACIKQLTDTIVELRIPKRKGFDYNPGQYVKIAIPDVSIFQWHPISISSSPNQTDITLHIRKQGVWTTQLHKLARKKDEIEICLEGPYGSLGVDLTSDRYSMVMLISGGIGVTPMQSIAHQLIYEHDWGERRMKKLWFVWTSRDPQVMSNMDVISRNNDSIKNFAIENATIIDNDHESSRGWDKCSAQKLHASASFIASNGFTGLPGSSTMDEEQDGVMSLNDFIDIDDEEQDEVSKCVQKNDDNAIINLETAGSVFTTETMRGLATNSHMVGDEVFGSESGELLELDCYLTSKEIQDCRLGELPFVNQCRPDMKKIFLSMRKEAIRKGEMRVAVCVCAPKRLVSITREACVKFSNRHVRFDFHSEVFD